MHYARMTPGLSLDEQFEIAQATIRRQQAAINIARRAINEAREFGWDGANQAIIDMNVALSGPNEDRSLQEAAEWISSTATAAWKFLRRIIPSWRPGL